MFLVIEHHLNYQFCPELIGKKYYEKNQVPIIAITMWKSQENT